MIDNLIPHEKNWRSIVEFLFCEKCGYFVAMSESVFNDLNKFDKTKKENIRVFILYIDNFGNGNCKNRKPLANAYVLDCMILEYMLFFGIIRQVQGLGRFIG